MPQMVIAGFQAAAGDSCFLSLKNFCLARIYRDEDGEDRPAEALTPQHPLSRKKISQISSFL